MNSVLSEDFGELHHLSGSARFYLDGSRVWYHSVNGPNRVILKDRSGLAPSIIWPNGYKKWARGTRFRQQQNPL